MGIEEDKFLLDNLVQTERNLIGIFQKLIEIETTKGIESNEFKSMCGLVQDFLAEEEACVISLMQEKFKYLADYMLLQLMGKEALKIDECMYALICDWEIFPLYRIRRLLLACDPATGRISKECALETGISEEINASFLKDVQDPTIKYKLAFLNPAVCYDMVQNNFNSSMLCPEVYYADLENDENYEKMKKEYYMTRFFAIFGTAALNLEKLTEDMYSLLISVKNPLSPGNARLALVDLSNNGVPFSKVFELSRSLEEKETERRVKSLNSMKNNLTTD